MSVDVSSRVWKHSKTQGSERVLMLALADRSDEYGVSWPSHDDNAERVNVTRRQARNLKKSCVENGELLSIEAATKQGRQTSNRYFVIVGLPLEKIEKVLREHPQLAGSWDDGRIEFELQRIERIRNATEEGGTTVPPEEELQYPPGGKPSTPTRGKPSTPEPSYETSLNPKKEPDSIFSGNEDNKDFLEFSIELTERERAQIEPVRMIAEHCASLLNVDIPEWNFGARWADPSERIIKRGSSAGLDITSIKEALTLLADKSPDEDGIGWLRTHGTSAKSFEEMFDAHVSRMVNKEQQAHSRQARLQADSERVLESARAVGMPV